MAGYARELSLERLGREPLKLERGGPTGDLYIFLTVRPHEFFQRDGADLFCKVPISMAVAWP